MQLSSNDNSNHADYQITHYKTGSAQINGKIITNSFIISPKQLTENWKPNTINEVTLDVMQQIFCIDAEIIILGTGDILEFPKPELYHQLLCQTPGIEIMGSAAACRTYNLLTSEERNVVAGIIL